MPYKPATLAVENTSRLHQKHQKKVSENVRTNYFNKSKIAFATELDCYFLTAVYLPNEIPAKLNFVNIGIFTSNLKNPIDIKF